MRGGGISTENVAVAARCWDGWQHIVIAKILPQAMKLSDDMAAIAGILRCLACVMGREESRPQITR